MKKDGLYYSIYINIVSIIIGILCIIFSIKTNKYLTISIVLFILIVIEMLINIFEIKKNKKSKK